jgi:hypothetical protein
MGFRLTEILLVLFILLLFLLPATDPTRSLAVQASTAPAALDAALERAATTAAGLSDGVTVIVTPNGSFQTSVATYANRPDQSQGALLNRAAVEVPVALPDGDTTFAFAVAHDGSAVVIDPYTTWAAATTGGATCSTITMTFGKGVWATTATLSCTTLGVAKT